MACLLHKAQQECSRFVVRRTFVEVVDETTLASDEDFAAKPSLMCRAQSDPALYEKSLHQLQSSSSYFEGSADPHDVEFELAGLSDGESSDTETEDVATIGTARSVAAAAERIDVGGGQRAKSATCIDHSTAKSPGAHADDEPAGWSDTVTESDVADERCHFPCYEHIPHSATSSSNPDDEKCVAADQGTAEDSGSGRVLQEMARLWRENARLALENQLLRESAVGASGAPFPANFGECQAERACSQNKAPAVPPGTWFNSASQADVPGMQHYGWGVPIDPSMWHTAAAPEEETAKQPKDPAASTRRRRRRKINSGANMVAEAGACSGEASAEDGEERRTTVMLRNLPNDYSRQTLLDMLDMDGFAGLYDFIYLPIDFKTQACLGYAFVNLTRPDVAAAFWAKFDGYTDWAVPSKKIGKVTWSGPHQGWAAHVGRYRNSPVMHPSVPEHYKPLIFSDGKVAEFPAPTKPPKAPRSRYMVFAGPQEAED